MNNETVVFPILMFNKSVKNELTQPASLVDIEDQEQKQIARKIITYLKNTLEFTGGYGIAANQVGILKSICLVRRSDGSIIEMINPTIVSASDEISYSLEGCLSIPWTSSTILRHDKVIVEYVNPNTWETVTVEFTNSPAGGNNKTRESYIAQHEIDHLNGILFIDRIPKEERSMKLNSNLYKLMLRGKLAIDYFHVIKESTKYKLRVPERYMKTMREIYDDDISDAMLISVK